MLRILHTNDFHGMLDEARESRLLRLRENCDVYFDCGDAIKAGNLALPLKPDPVWPRLERLHCTASVPGNRESHIAPALLAKKIEGNRHPILCANMHLKSGEPVFPGHLIVEVAGLKIGLVAVMVPMVTKRMATQAASAYLWEPPVATAVAEGALLRDQVDCLIALTHIGLRQDREIAEKTNQFDLILGGHSHNVLEEPVFVGRTAICQTGSHARYAGVYAWDAGRGLVDYRLEPL